MPRKGYRIEKRVVVLSLEVCFPSSRSSFYLDYPSLLHHPKYCSPQVIDLKFPRYRLRLPSPSLDARRDQR